MASISAYDSSSIGVLFSSITNNSSSNKSSGSDLLGINYNDYATIRNGSYFKLMKAYYSEDVSKSVSSIASTSTSEDSAKTLTTIESDSEDLSNAADKLLETGSKSLFKKTQTTDSEGKVTSGYATDDIYKAVKDFAENYNELVESASDSKTSNISSAASRLVNLTKANSKLLSSVGVTLDADNKLTVDENKLKAADMSTVESLFNSRGGYGYQVSAQSSMIHYYAENEASKSNTYGSSGAYTYNYNTGTLYNTTT